jgi:RNA polymerase sigma-70 factor (ECF subfamily)
MGDARAAALGTAESAARSSYGKLVAILAARTGDIAGAEDALSDAFAAALATWPERGVPDNPAAWLLTAARRNLGHVRGRAATAQAGRQMIELLAAERIGVDPVPFSDERLKLMLVCASPGIARDVQAPLMLQTVLGIDAARIASAFLVSPAAMRRQLVRAKARIRDAGIAFAVPEPAVATGRIDAVLSAVYVAYGTGWEDVLIADAKHGGLAAEAIWLGRLLCELLPSNAEALGLLTLMLHCEARRDARRDGTGAFVPLRDQDVRRWSRPMIIEAEAALRRAAEQGPPGPFQAEAAIQSLHAHQCVTGESFGHELRRLYDLLVAVSPSIGARVARAAAYAETGSPAQAVALLDGIVGCESYQPWWVARARALWLTGAIDAARAAVQHAAGLSSDPAVRAFLLAGRLFGR